MKNNIGFLTLDEFLTQRNSREVSHSTTNYDVSLKHLNKDYTISPFGELWNSPHEDYVVFQTSRGFFIKKSKELVAVVKGDTVYHNSKIHKSNFKKPLTDQNKDLRDKLDLSLMTHKRVKYTQDYLPLVSNVALTNKNNYKLLIKRIKVKDEQLEIRAEKKPEIDKQDTIVILNEENLVVAMVSDEWGATLLRVVREYRGFRLGVLLTRIWHHYNPNWTSGGFTESGKRSTILVWQEVVRENLEQGLYSKALKEKKITKERLTQILKDLPKRKEKKVIVKEEKKPSKTLFYINMQDEVFVIYDSQFFDDPSEKHIYAYGFFRGSRGKTFLYSIDYEKKYRKLANYVALQMAKDLGFSIYVGGKLGDDLMELNGMEDIEVKDDHAYLLKDKINISLFSSAEKKERKSRDPYREVEYLLLEVGESKWK